jgi:hypothetical protein
MPRAATWNEVLNTHRAFEELKTFRAVESITTDFFAHNDQVPARVEIALMTGSEYDDEVYFTTVSITGWRVFDAAGQALTPYKTEANSETNLETNTSTPLSEDGFWEALEEQVCGLEWNIHEHLCHFGHRGVIDLLDPPPNPPVLFVLDDPSPKTDCDTLKEEPS